MVCLSPKNFCKIIIKTIYLPYRIITRVMSWCVCINVESKQLIKYHENTCRHYSHFNKYWQREKLLLKYLKISVGKSKEVSS